MHMGWAFLACCACWRSRHTRWFALLFAIMTAICTLTTGEHYLVDLAAAFPFSLALWAFCMNELPFSDPGRILPIALGLLGYLSWVFTIRFTPQIFWYSRLVPWTFLLLSVGGTLWALRSEFRSVSERRPKEPEERHSIASRSA